MRRGSPSTTTASMRYTAGSSARYDGEDGSIAGYSSSRAPNCPTVTVRKYDSTVRLRLGYVVMAMRMTVLR